MVNCNIDCNKQEKLQLYCWWRCCSLLLGKHRCVLFLKYVIFCSTMIKLLSGGKKGNICGPVKSEFWLFEVQLRGVGLYLPSSSSVLIWPSTADLFAGCRTVIILFCRLISLNINQVKPLCIPPRISSWSSKSNGSSDSQAAGCSGPA